MTGPEAGWKLIFPNAFIAVCARDVVPPVPLKWIRQLLPGVLKDYNVSNVITAMKFVRKSV
jgi:hypothetical protein